MAASARRRNRASNAQHYLPAVYLGVAVLAAVLILPSALRPPNQQPNQTAELSPDAPPDKNQTAIISALNRASSGVQGVDSTSTTVAQGLASATTTTLAAAAPPRACPGGVGNPPRQIASPYAPPCAAPFVGNNGGATYAGVSATEVRVGVRGTGNKGGADDCGTNGRIDDMDPNNMDAATRTFYVLEKYFNRNFQLYGRRVSFYCIEPASLSIPDEEAAAVDAANTYHVFGSPTTSSNSCDQLVTRGLVSFCEGLPPAYYQQHSPLVYGAYQSAEEQIGLLSEFACKALVGKQAQDAGDPKTQSETRKFAYVLYDGGRGYAPDADIYKQDLKQGCGADLDVILISSAQDNANQNAALAAAATTMSQHGDTTVTPGMDFVDLAELTNAAAANGYFPEWYIGDGGADTRNQLGQFQNQAEWQHAFGVSASEPERPDNANECFRAYHSIDPGNNPDAVICRYEWNDILMFVSGLQTSGPKVTPQSYQQGWFSLGMRYYDHPVWAMGGGFAPGVYNYPHNVDLVWWNPKAQDPSNSTNVGAYEFLYNARRFCAGQIPAAAYPQFFNPNDSVLLPPDYASEDASPPRPTCPPFNG